MDEIRKTRQELEQDLEWIKYRQSILNIIERKLLQMKQLVEKIKNGDFNSEQILELNNEINNLALQVRALDEESRNVKSE